MEDDSSMSYENSIGGKKLQRFQDDFCRLIGVCAICIDAEGRECTKPSGLNDDLMKFSKYISELQLIRLFKRVSGSDMEDEAIEDTEVPDVKYGAVVVRTGDGKCDYVWILQAAISDPDTEGYMKPAAGGFSRTLSVESFICSLDLLRGFSGCTAAMHLSADKIQAEAICSRSYEKEFAEKDKRYHALAEIIQILDYSENEEDVTGIFDKLIRSVVVNLGISSAQVYQIHQEDRKMMDVVTQFCVNGTVSTFDHTRNLSRLPFLYTDQLMTYNEGQKTDANITDACREMGIKAFVVLPITIRGEIAMYMCFCEVRQEHMWNVNEIQLMKYAAIVMQSIVKLKIDIESTRNSVKFQNAALSSTGTVIYFRDIDTGDIVYENDLLKRDFSAEYSNGELSEIFEKNIPENSKTGCIEVEYKKKNRWYELNYSTVRWINGRSTIRIFSIHDETEKKNYQKRIEQQAYTDYLTGLYNRMCCERDLAKYVDHTRSDGRHGTLLYMDLDDFKHINDGLGHQYGDVLLRAIAHSIRNIRGIDNTCYRMGGDEFVIIIPPEAYDEEKRILDEIRYVFNRPWFLKDADYYCTMSMGVVHFPDDGIEVQDLIKKADIAMYEAKKSGKNRVSAYKGYATVNSSRRLDMEKYMRDAVTNDCREFEVYYQPIIDMKLSGKPCSGAEALIRWNSPNLGFISPADFIPLAEYLGLINPIGEYVLREACAACHEWNEQGHPGYKVNVNLSVVQLIQPDIVDKVLKALNDTGLKPCNLTLEVTESLAINDMSRMREILQKIRATGVRIALDDFGTGYSSLNHIREIPLDVIKVDQSFVRDLSTDSYSQSFIRMISDLCSTIDKRICVEGIEMEDQYKILDKMNVRLVQGFYFDKPMPLDAFERKYVDNGVIQNEENELENSVSAESGNLQSEKTPERQNAGENQAKTEEQQRTENNVKTEDDLKKAEPRIKTHRKASGEKKTTRVSAKNKRKSAKKDAQN